MAATSYLGCGVKESVADQRDIFSESFSRAIVEVAPENKEAFESFAAKYLPFEFIGRVGGTTCTINDVSMELEQLKNIYFNHFQEVIEQDL